MVNRKELADQTARNLSGEVGYILSGTKKIPETPVTIGMVESVYNRQKKGSVNLNDYNLVIVDEVQNLQFAKVFVGYAGRLLGFTATPCTDKKEYYKRCRVCEKKTEASTHCNIETQDFTRSVSLSQYYGPLIQGVGVADLIAKGYLTPVQHYSSPNDDLDKLKTDAGGGFTASSIDKVFNNWASLSNLIDNYKEHAEGKKVMVFNSNIEANNTAFEAFKERGVKVWSYDSKSKANRAEIIEEFRSASDGVLMSVGVFVAGFDVDDVEVIILNRAISSLSLYHQIVGRGARITDKKDKRFFKCIDLGENYHRFRDTPWEVNFNWESIYTNTTEKKKGIVSLESFKECKSCGAFIDTVICSYCGHDNAPKQGEAGRLLAKAVNRLPQPKAKQILTYAKARGLDVNGAKVETANYILDMFRAANTSKSTAGNNWGYITNEIRRMIKPIYFELHKSDLPGNRIRTIEDFEKKVHTKIIKYYDTKED